MEDRRAFETRLYAGWSQRAAFFQAQPHPVRFIRRCLPKASSVTWTRWWPALVLTTFLITACRPGITSTPLPTSTATLRPTWTPLPTERDRWPELLERTPVPWTTPLPPEEATPLDGLYVKHDASEPQWWNCRRCADYQRSGGLWRLQFESGVFRIYYTESGWRSLGSYTVDGDQLALFNDPYCQYETGLYTWQLDNGQLSLTEIDDPCSTSFRLRAANLTYQPWLACQPAGVENAEDWMPPPGCE